MMIIFAAAIGIVIILLLGAYLCLHATFGKRCEGNPELKYLTHKDVDNLMAEPISFFSDKGQRLCGAIYTYQGIENPLGLVVFSHGMGGGHLSYTTIIHSLAKSGFVVLAYDNTGTMASDGEALGSFYQAVKDLRAALDFAREDSRLSKYKIILVGHSWGGYAVCQALAFETLHVVGVVAFSPPESFPRVICDNMRQTLGIPMTWLQPALWVASATKDGWKSCHKSSSVLLRIEHTPIMIFQGDEDKAVLFSNSPLSNPAIIKKENITAVICKGRAHNVYQTKEAEHYLGEVFSAIAMAQKQYGKQNIPPEKKSQLYNIDYKLIRQEDSGVMEAVVSFIKKCVGQ